jgi:hypothetical protein
VQSEWIAIFDCLSEYTVTSLPLFFHVENSAISTGSASAEVLALYQYVMRAGANSTFTWFTNVRDKQAIVLLHRQDEHYCPRP